ncbi:hypothetical protein BABINDRAFT_44157 [Babjeviella inositovora NRRL Y-12698]|uniref:tRNA-dihydrouridine(47) synthase [NAD(P)(+)] n=1 Tax=Babjeviella inositovora NRRL Y-12698 TaxID=984486 RepID=A0A1E3QZ83_9ASCO|nr:uncharacterized protein BABINDRAFT_44157 [Babjeviella inositovora NRRL Y-12698]ODQ82925.1 hypothetical protein BABINDRAFT_44157 [Babjeviella inositovora NRRL Y-12698]
MSDETLKRPVSPVQVEPEAKKQHTEGLVVATPQPKDDHFAKGIAPIKAEYLIPHVPGTHNTITFDDEEGLGDREDAGEEGSDKRGKGRGKKARGQNKKRDLAQHHETIRLCSTVLDPENVKECRFGASKCRNTHNVEEYLASKPADIEGICPVFRAIGYCPAGLKCRWLHSHYNKELNKLIKDLGVMEAAKQNNYEVNKADIQAKAELQRKKFDFAISNRVIPYLDSLVQKDLPKKSTQDKTKELMNAYVEAPFKPAEKKRLNLHRAKIVSPLTTVGNLPYRRLMKTLGADVTYSEMALAFPVVNGANAEWALPKAHLSEYPGFGVQIATAKHWQAVKATEALAKLTTHVSEINLNSGCPIDLLYRQGQGSALMEQPARMVRILNGMNMASGDIPVTLKIRTGTRDGHWNGAAVVKRVLNDTDVAAITMHGRSRQQRYSKEANWDYIGQVGEIVEAYNNDKEEDKDSAETRRVFFVGNGDCYNFEDWNQAVERKGVDSVMVARGALIKPWIFEEVEAGQYLDKSATERLDILRTYANFAIEHWGSDEYGIKQARRFMCEFLSFFHRYIPVGIMERMPAKLNQRPPMWKGRDDLETLLASTDYRDWIKITEMFLGKVGEDFHFTPKHKSNAYEPQA